MGGKQMKQLIIIMLLFVGCGGGGGSGGESSDPTPINTNPPVLDSVIVYDDYFEHVGPKIWRIGNVWNMTITYHDPDGDIDHAVCNFYTYDTLDLYSGPYVFDISGEQHGDFPVIVTEDEGLYQIGCVVVDSEGNESGELFDYVKIIEP